MIEGTAESVTPLEQQLLVLARDTCERAATLTPTDLQPLRALVAAGAAEYAVVAGAFHFVNRIADLLHVDPEALPETLRRFEWLRRLTVSFAARLMKRMDLANRGYAQSLDDATADLRRLCPATTDVTAAVESLRETPQAVEILALAVREQRERSTLDARTLSCVHRVVEDALPRSAADLEGFPARPVDPVEAFAFVGTRHPARTTRVMIDRLRAAGYGDRGILDLAIAVADANQWARMSRLLGLDPHLFYLA